MRTGVERTRANFSNLDAFLSLGQPAFLRKRKMRPVLVVATNVLN